MSHIERDTTENENRGVATQFVSEAISLIQQLDAVIGKPFLPERPMFISRSQKSYEDLLSRRRSLVLSPLSQWAVDLLLDGVRTRLQILTEPVAAPENELDLFLSVRDLY